VTQLSRPRTMPYPYESGSTAVRCRVGRPSRNLEVEQHDAAPTSSRGKEECPMAANDVAAKALHRPREVK
jgi:hypothetical protein